VLECAPAGFDDFLIMDLLRHWNLRERPFERRGIRVFFYAGPDHEEALSRLLYLVSETTMNLGLLTGEIGSGKTLTRAVFAGRIDATRFHVLTVEIPASSSTNCWARILRRLDPQIHMMAKATRTLRKF